jgi:hypothetical protein
MNFLFHHHLALRDLGSLEAATGAMLPDLWRLADRRVRPRPEPALPGDDALRPLERLVMAGVRHHLEADRWFHRADVFRDGEARTAERLRQMPIAAKRLPLFAHVLWEMCLDGALVRLSGLAEVRRSIGDGLRIVTSAQADQHLADHCHFAASGRPEAERTQFQLRLAAIVERLIASDWVDGYARGDGLADRLNGIRRGLGFSAFAADERVVVADVCEHLLDDAASAAQTLARMP